MIQLTLYKTAEGSYRGFSCKGHAGYGKYGQDIVCAGTSALVLTTLQSIEKLTEDDILFTVREESGYVACKFQNTASEGSELLLDALVLGFEAIRENYGKKYVSINFKETR